MSLKTSALVGIALLATAPLAAQTTPPVAETPKPKKERRICRDEGDTGSRFVKRVCHTESEWAAIDATSRGGPVRDNMNGVRR